MAEYEFMRRLARGVPQSTAETVAAALLENGIEVYALDAGADAPGAGEANMSDAGADVPGAGRRKSGNSARYVSADASAQFPNGEIYVPAADRERAAEILGSAGAIQYLCDDPVESLELTGAEQMQADMLRRQRRNMVICLVVIVLAAVYYAFF